MSEAAEAGLGSAAIILGDHAYHGYIRYENFMYGQRPVNHEEAIQVYMTAGDRPDALFRLSRF